MYVMARMPCGHMAPPPWSAVRLQLEKNKSTAWMQSGLKYRWVSTTTSRRKFLGVVWLLRQIVARQLVACPAMRDGGSSGAVSWSAAARRTGILRVLAQSHQITAAVDRRCCVLLQLLSLGLLKFSMKAFAMNGRRHTTFC